MYLYNWVAVVGYFIENLQLKSSPQVNNFWSISTSKTEQIVISRSTERKKFLWIQETKEYKWKKLPSICINRTAHSNSLKIYKYEKTK